MVSFFPLYLIRLALCALFGVSILSQAPAAEDSGRYFLVLDHSGSMLTKINSGQESGRSRWEVLRDRASGFAGRLPEGANVWAGVFSARDPNLAGDLTDPFAGWLTPVSGSFDDGNARDNFVARLQAFPEPGLANGTWLNQAMMESLLKVEAAGQNDPEGYLTVLIYTDGMDQGHGRTTAEMIRNKGSICTRTEVDAKIKLLKARHRNFNVVYVYRPGDESIMDAHVVRLTTNKIQLPSPLVAPEQSFDIDLRFKDDERLKLEGRPFKVSWLKTAEAPAPAIEITGGPFKMTNGKVRINFRKSGDWPSGRDIRGSLKLEYPTLKDAFLVEEGGSVIDVLFQGAEAPKISDLLPADGSLFPTGREISFSLSTLPGCEIEWSFGDGSSAQGESVKHRYDEPGSKEIVARVKDPRTGLSAVEKFTITLTELRLNLDPLPVHVLPGEQVLLTAKATGDFREFFWDVAGRTYAGRPRGDGIEGSEVKVAFERPGMVTIRAWGDGKMGGRAETQPASLSVREVPALRLTSPAPGEVLYFNSRRELRAEVDGVEANQIRFSLEVDGKPLVPAVLVDVQRQGTLRTAVLPFMVPTLPQRASARLITETVGVTPALRREIELRLENEPASIQIILPEGREPQIHNETPIRLETNAKVTDVRWDFGDGDGLQDGREIERHKWTAYGTFEIRATAIGPDGAELVAMPVEIRIPVRSVVAQATVIYKGKRVGAEVSKVPVNATLELKADVQGDVTRTRWFLDGTELPLGQETVTVKERGFKTLQLVVDATPEAGGAGAANASVEFRTSDKILFWALAVGCLALLGLAGRVLLGNKWRFAKLDVGKEVGGSYSDGGSLKMPWSIRSWWTKRADISMSVLDKKTCPGWQGDTRVRFEAGKDPKLQPLGPEWQGRRLESENSKLLKKSYIKRWSFARIPLMKKHPDRNEYRNGTINLAIPALKPGILGRWPELLFLCLSAGFVAGMRLLYQSFY